MPKFAFTSAERKRNGKRPFNIKITKNITGKVIKFSEIYLNNKQ